MNILRWMIFLPVGVLTFTVGQIVTQDIGGFSIIFMLLLGVIPALAGAFPVLVSPDKKIGASILISLFVLMELFALSKAGITVSRIYADLAIIAGALLATIPQKGSS